MHTTTFIIISDIINPTRHGETFTIAFDFGADKHSYKHFKPVSDWADGAIIKEVEL